MVDANISVRIIFKEKDCFVVVTTAKDWVKVQPLVQKVPSKIQWYVIRVAFDFLQMHDHQRFSTLLTNLLDHS